MTVTHYFPTIFDSREEAVDEMIRTDHHMHGGSPNRGMWVWPDRLAVLPCPGDPAMGWVVARVAK